MRKKLMKKTPTHHTNLKSSIGKQGDNTIGSVLFEFDILLVDYMYSEKATIIEENGLKRVKIEIKSERKV